MLFVLADAGLARYLGRKPDPAKVVSYPYGLYTALGFGYCRVVTKRGMGPFASVSARGATFRQRSLNPIFTPEQAEYAIFDARVFLSLGFKF